MTRKIDGERVSTWLAELARARAPEDALQAGDVVGGGRYRIEAERGRGGMGVVYRAQDTKLSRVVALKTHQVLSADSRERLLTEAQAMAKLSHPNVLAIHDVGEYDDGVFLVADFVAGGDLQAWKVPERRWSEVVRAFIEAGRGLAYSHDAGLVHGDFKPSNVLVSAGGRCQVTDFGLATPEDLRSREESPAPTDTLELGSGLAGTPAFMAPEQLAGAPATTLSDQFSFCVALSEALLGRRPYENDARELLSRAEPLHPGDSGVPTRVLRVLDRGLAVRPRDRHASMHVLLGRLEAAAAPRRKIWLAVPGLALASAAAALAAPWSLEPPCTKDVSALSAWTPQSRTALREVFERDPHAQRRWPAVAETVDAYAAAWSQTDHALCERTESPSEFTLQAKTCLDRLRRDADATLFSLQRASGRAARHGLERVEAWIRPSTCLQPDFVRAIERPSVFLRPEVSRLEHEIRKAGNAANNGRDLGAIAERLERLRPQVTRLGLPSLEARLAFSEVELFLRTDGSKIEETLKGAYRASREAENSHFAALASSKLAEILALHLGDAPAALEWAEVALTEAQRPGVPRGLLALAMRVAAIAYDVAGQWDEAALRYERALEAAEAAGPERDRRRAGVLVSLSGFEYARGNLDRAIETGTEAAEILQRLDGGVSHASLNAMSNVGLAFAAAGRLHEARDIFERELEHLEALLGEHPSLIATYLNLAMVAEREERFDDAAAFWRRADALVVRFHGEEHPDRGHIESELAWLDINAGRFGEARARFERAERRLERGMGPQAEATLLAAVGLSTARLAAGERKAACAPLEDHVNTAREALGEGRVLSRLQRAQADCAVDRGDLERAESLYRRSLALAEKVSDTMSLRLEEQLSLAKVLHGLGSRDEARELCERVFRHPDVTARTKKRAGTLLESLQQSIPIATRPSPSSSR